MSNSFELAASARLLQSRFSSISASRESVTGRGGVLDVEVTVGLGPSKKSNSQAVGKLNLVINGYPREGAEKNKPEFSIKIEVRGVFEWKNEVTTLALEDTDLTAVLCQPLYLKALAMVDVIAAGLGFPGLKLDQDFRLAPNQVSEVASAPAKRKKKVAKDVA